MTVARPTTTTRGAGAPRYWTPPLFVPRGKVPQTRGIVPRRRGKVPHTRGTIPHAGATTEVPPELDLFCYPPRPAIRPPPPIGTGGAGGGTGRPPHPGKRSGRSPAKSAHCEGSTDSIAAST